MELDSACYFSYNFNGAGFNFVFLIVLILKGVGNNLGNLNVST